jgi:SpoVK/Ycf46/Vps4 family AAA+-type ATPase
MNNNTTNTRNYETFLSRLDDAKVTDKDFDGIKDKYYYSFNKQNLKINIENPNDFKYLLEPIQIPDAFIKPIAKEKINIIMNINNIGDLIQLTKNYQYDDSKEYNINLKALHNILPPLQELNDMIGMKSIKESIIDQILYYLQNLHMHGSGDYMHTVIYGPPGTGKTEVAKIIGKIFCNLGVLGGKEHGNSSSSSSNTSKFKKVSRSDLIAGYLGQTAMKTKDAVKDCLGGVLFIDEAYSLGNNEKKDSFAKECIDTLCESLSDQKENIMVIIAGYEHELNECFFNYNQGLKSRFPWRFKVDNYTSEELYKIFMKKVNDSGWSVTDTNINYKWFDKQMVYFKFYGRDIEILFSKIKIAHSRRVFCLDVSEKTKIIMDDLTKGFELYLQNDEIKNRKEQLYRNSTLNLYV